MKKAFAKQEQGLCFSTLTLLPRADSKSDYVELTCSRSLALLTKEQLCADIIQQRYQQISL